MPTQINIEPAVWCIGVDPGLTGAIAIVREQPSPAASVIDMPIKRGLLDAESIATHIEDLRRARVTVANGGPSQNEVVGCIEVSQPGATPASKRSVATFWEGIGILEGVFCALRIPFIRVLPREWRMGLGVKSSENRKEDKEISKAEAAQRFPDAYLGKRGDAGRAEALLIALWGLRTMSLYDLRDDDI